MDIVLPQTRSRMMSGINSGNTKPELIIRKALHRSGFRYKLQDKSLPGKPDLVFPRYKAVIFVHGCFWHGHDCHLFKWPKTRPDFWRAKITGNKKRDIRVLSKLDSLGWRTGIVWECSIKGGTKLSIEIIVQKCAQWLKGSSEYLEIKGE